jgi:Domain of unknown function (DUF4160)
MAPTIVRDGQFRLFFFSREETRIHVHIAHPDGEAKFWLIPFLNHPCTLSASLAVRLYCRRFTFAFTNDLEIELHPRWV